MQCRYYPPEQNPFEAYGRLFGASAESVEALVRLNAVLSDPSTRRALAALREDDANVRAEAEPMTIQ